MTRAPFRTAPLGMALAAALLLLEAGPAAADPAHPDRAAKTAAAPPPQGQKPGTQTTASKTPLVLVVGDRFATALADGLDADTSIVVARTTGDGFGLTRPGFTEALGTIRDRLARPDKPALAAVLVGADDGDPLTDAAGRFEPGTLGWQRIYGARVDSVAKLFHDAGVPLVWVGLPAMRSPELSADFVRRNGIVRDRTARDGVAYVDSFDAFTDASGRYSPMGPDADGTVTKLRRAGGLGFTHAGARKLASFIAPDIARLGRSSAAASADTLANLTIERARDFDAALDVDVNAQIRREAARTGSDAAHGTAEAPAAAPPQGPPAGPVLPLTAPPTSPDGQLASLALPAGAPPRPSRARRSPAAPTISPGRNRDGGSAGSRGRRSCAS